MPLRAACGRAVTVFARPAGLRRRCYFVFLCRAACGQHHTKSRRSLFFRGLRPGSASAADFGQWIGAASVFFPLIAFGGGKKNGTSAALRALRLCPCPAPLTAALVWIGRRRFFPVCPTGLDYWSTQTLSIHLVDFVDSPRGFCRFAS